MTCSSCGTAVADDARFCFSCGHDLTRRADERRVVTVLFADIVGFTKLSENLDPEQVKHLVDDCFAQLAHDIDGFGGKVDKVVGDAIVALFGAPVAHEDDAERAVRAAFAMQESVERFESAIDIDLRLRIGVNTGEVLVGAIAAGDDYTAMGDVVNIASRLQTSAEPGTISVGPATHEATVDLIQYVSLGTIEARGRDVGVSAWRAIAPIGQPGERVRGPQSPLIGREPELELMRRAVTTAFDRARAQLLVIYGESGMGKTRVAAEVVDRAAHESDALVLRGRCLPYGEANAWWPLAEAVRGAIGIDASLDPEATELAVAGSVAHIFRAEISDPDVVRTTNGLLYVLGHNPPNDSTNAETAVVEGGRAVRALLHALSRRGPVLLWLADLHYADDLILRVLDQTLDRLGRHRVVVLVSSRSLLLDRWAPRPVRYNSSSVSLDPLDPTAADALARELLGPGSDPHVRQQVVERSGGNPLFIEELARMVAGGGDLDTLPANVRSVLGARLDTLDPAALAIVEDASVIGLHGSVDALERTARGIRNVRSIDEALAQVDRADVLEVVRGQWSFRSNLLRDVAYGRLTKTDRALRHASMADYLESAAPGRSAETIAHHLRRASELQRELGAVPGLSDTLRDRALEWTLRSADANSGTRAGERAEQLYTEALALLDHDEKGEQRARLLLDRADATLRVQRIDSARNDLEAAAPIILGLADSQITQKLRVRLALLQSEVAQWSSDFGGALRLAETALAEAIPVGDPVLTGDALRRRGMVQIFLAQPAEAEASFLSAFDSFTEAKHQPGVAWALQNLAWISYIVGRMEQAETQLDQSIETFERLGDSTGQAWSTGLLAYVRIHQGRFVEAEDLARRTLTEARESGDRWGEGLMIVVLANVALGSGRVDEAIRRAEQARSIFGQRTDPIGSIQTATIYARALVRAGRTVDAFENLLEVSDLALGPLTNEWLSSTFAVCAVTAGDVDGASVHLTEVHEIAFDEPLPPTTHERLVAQALHQFQTGAVVEASRLLNSIVDIKRPDDLPWGWAVLALVETAMGREPHEQVDAINNSKRATYRDVVLAACAEACFFAKRSDSDASESAINRAIEAIPAGGDRMHPMIVAVAAAQCASSLGSDDLEDLEKRAQRLAAALGVDAVGWWQAFSAAARQIATEAV